MIRNLSRIDDLASPALRLLALVVVLIAAATLATASDHPGGDEVELTGVVTATVASASFVLDGTTTVTTDAGTEWEGGLTGWTDLEAGLEVEVKGWWTVEGSEVAAKKVKRTELAGGGGGEEDGESGDGTVGIRFGSHSRVVDVLPPDRFAMYDGRTYLVDAATRFDPVIGGFAGLEAGQYLEVEAYRLPDGRHLAREIEYEGDAGSGQGYGKVYGEVAAVTSTALELAGGEVVLHDQLTEWKGDADRWQDVAPGWRVEAEVFHDRFGQQVAREVRCDDDRLAGVEGEDFEPHEAVAVLTEGADPVAIADHVGAELVATVGEIAVLLRWPEELDDNLLAAVAADPGIAAVEPNYRFRDPESVRRRYPIVDGRSGMQFLRSQNAATVANLRGAAIRASGRGAVVALVDTGVDPEHPALRGRLLPAGIDLVDGDDSPFETRDGLDSDGDGEIDEAAGHGTFVASVVAAVAPGAALLPIRVLDDDGGGSAFSLAVGLAHAIEAEVDVINLSLVYRRRSAAVDLLLERAAARGIVVVASAGNDGAEVVPFPASDSHVIGVTAVGLEATTLAAFANRSGTIGVAAPGEEILGALDGERYGTWSGTSMAAPFVTGTVALMKSIDHELTVELVRGALLQGSAPLADGQWQGVRLDAGGTLGLIASVRATAPVLATGRVAPVGRSGG